MLYVGLTGIITMKPVIKPAPAVIALASAYLSGDRLQVIIAAEQLLAAIIMTDPKTVRSKGSPNNRTTKSGRIDLAAKCKALIRQA